MDSLIRALDQEVQSRKRQAALVWQRRLGLFARARATCATNFACRQKQCVCHRRYFQLVSADSVCSCQRGISTSPTVCILLTNARGTPIPVLVKHVSGSTLCCCQLVVFSLQCCCCCCCYCCCITNIQTISSGYMKTIFHRFHYKCLWIWVVLMRDRVTNIYF